MSGRGAELVTTDKPAIVSKLLLDATMVEDGEGDRCLPDPPWTDESDWREVFCEADDLLDQLVAAETDPRRRWRGLPWRAILRYNGLNP